MGHDKRGELVVVDISAAPAPDPEVAFADAVSVQPRPTGLERRVDQWWSTAARPARVVLVAAMALTALAVGAFVVGVGATRAVHVQTATVVDPARPSGVNALGCPVDRECGVRWPGAAADFLEQIHPNLTVSGYETFDLKSGATYRRDLVATSPKPMAVLRIVAQCVPNGPHTYESGAGLVKEVREGRIRFAETQGLRFDPNGCTTWGASREQLGPSGRPYQTDPDAMDTVLASPFIRVTDQ
ncbi:MAG: hypothetical protein ABJA87_11785 [bacterium]